jgi:hypothetical protein
MTGAGILNTNTHSIDRAQRRVAGDVDLLATLHAHASTQQQALTNWRSYAGRALLAQVNAEEEAVLAHRCVTATPVFCWYAAAVGIALASEEAQPRSGLVGILSTASRSHGRACPANKPAGEASRSR